MKNKNVIIRCFDRHSQCWLQVDRLKLVHLRRMGIPSHATLERLLDTEGRLGYGESFQEETFPRSPALSHYYPQYVILETCSNHMHPQQQCRSMSPSKHRSLKLSRPK